MLAGSFETKLKLGPCRQPPKPEPGFQEGSTRRPAFPRACRDLRGQRRSASRRPAGRAGPPGRRAGRLVCVLPFAAGEAAAPQAPQGSMCQVGHIAYESHKADWATSRYSLYLNLATLE